MIKYKSTVENLVDMHELVSYKKNIIIMIVMKQPFVYHSP